MGDGSLGSSSHITPTVQTFVKGWFALMFKFLTHTNCALSTIWHIDQAYVLLWRWTSMFDREHERVEAGPIWFHLSGFPCHFWIEEISRWIGDGMGSYLTPDGSFQTTVRMAYARILVHLDLLDGLPEYNNIQWSNVTRRQMLDYEGVPFRCRCCHKVGHLFRDCPLNGWNYRKAAR